jgi:AAA domain-containing protein
MVTPGSDLSEESRSIWSELEEWSRSFAPWQRLLLAAAVRSTVVSVASIDQAYLLFLAEHDLKPAPVPYPEIPELVTGRPLAAATQYRLRRVHSPHGVNRLPTSSELTFGDGLTVIYGANGVGKSGFTRILSNACFSRQQHPIYPDVFDEIAPTTPSAIIELADPTGTPVSLTFDNSTEHSVLKLGFTVFDSFVAERHLTQTDPIAFVPTGFDVFAEMARGYAALQTRLSAEIEKRTRNNNFHVLFSGESTEVSDIVSRLGRFTDLDKLRALASYGESERARIDHLERLDQELRATSPIITIRHLTELRPQIIDLKQTLCTFRDLMSEEMLAWDRTLRKRFTDAVSAVAHAGRERFAHPKLLSIGSRDWEQLVIASQRFSALQHHKYPLEEDVCLLCQQQLGSEAVSLFGSYHEFITGDAIDELNQVNSEIDSRSAQLRALQPEEALTEGDSLYRFLEQTHPNILNAIADAIKGLATLRNSASAFLSGNGTQDSLAVPDFSALLDETLRQLDDDLTLLQRQDVSESLQRIASERRVLMHREILCKHLDDLIAFVSDEIWIATAERAKRELSSRHLTEKEQALFATVIAEQYRNTLAAACGSLGCTFPIEFRTQGKRGQTVRTLLIQDYSPTLILSEGEQKALALADFLTEVSLNQNNVGIILDDPVTSLDHDRKEKIAVRLTQEAKARQVVIFTHDMVFLSKLCDAADRNDEHVTIHWMQRSGDDRPGLVSLNDSPTTTPQYRTTGFAEDTFARAKVATGSVQERLIRQGAGQLRRTVEEIVPQYLFKEVVRRWTDRVMVTALRRVAWDNSFVDEIVEVFEACSAIMEGHSHTEGGAEAPPTLTKLEQLIQKTKELIRRAKESRNV